MESDRIANPKLHLILVNTPVVTRTPIAGGKNESLIWSVLILHSPSSSVVMSVTFIWDTDY